MGEYTRNLVSDLQHSHRTADSAVRLTLNIGDIPLCINEAIPCGLIINELVSNALKHAFQKARREKSQFSSHEVMTTPSYSW